MLRLDSSREQQLSLWEAVLPPELFLMDEELSGVGRLFSMTGPGTSPATEVDPSFAHLLVYHFADNIRILRPRSFIRLGHIDIFIVQS